MIIITAAWNLLDLARDIYTGEIKRGSQAGTAHLIKKK